MPKTSKIGCFFQLENEPIVGSRLEMEISLPPEILGYPVGKFHCQGEVVRVETPGNEGKSKVVCTIDKYQFMAPAADVGKDVEKAE